MRRVLFTSVLMLAAALAARSGPSSVLAQDPRTPADTVPATDTVPPAVQPPRETPLLAQRPRRRGSMVGYVEDATIGTRLRLRYETAFRNHLPDRAEFFYAKCGCFRAALGDDGLPLDPDARGPGPEIPSYIDFQQLYLWGEVAVLENLSAFVNVPLRWITPQFTGEATPTDPEFDSEVGLSDVRVGLKYGVISQEERALTLQLQGYLTSGDAERGMGTSHYSIEPALLFYQRAGERLTIEGQGGIWVPFARSNAAPAYPDDDFAGSILFYGIGPSYEIYRGESFQFAPVIELVGWQVLGGYQTAPTGMGDASGTSIVNLKIGGRAGFGAGSVYLGYGRALTDQSWYEEILRVEYRHDF